MSNKDVTRFLDQPEKHYVAGRLQQGRVLLDSDYNESHQLFERDRQAALLDLLGPKASPAQGFGIGSSRPWYGSANVHLHSLMQGDHLAVHQLVLGDQSEYVHGVTLLPGSMYVGGLRFEQVQAEHVALQRGFLQMRQGNGLPYLHRSLSPSPESPHSPKLVYSPSSPSSPFSPERSPISPDSPNTPDFPSFRNFYYLNAWEQAVTAIEDEELLESALGGPDTTVRIRRMHRVEVLGQLPRYIDSCGEAFEELIRNLEASGATFDRETYELKSNGRLQLVFQKPQLRDQCEECTLDPNARYLGQENQALRIMLSGPGTYVWGFDNGAPLYRIKVTGISVSSPSKVTVELLTPPKDQEHYPRRHQVVEIIPFAAVLDGAEQLKPDHPHFQKIADEIGVFLRVKDDYDPTTKTFELETGPTSDVADRIQRVKRFVTSWCNEHPAKAALNMDVPNDGDARYFYMRVWHRAEEAWQIELPTSGDPQGEALGDTGIVPVFHAAGRPGDSWLATLRVDEPERITPYALLTAAGGVPPQGPRHYYAPLGFVHGDGNEVYGVSDCRKTIKRVTERSCATRTVGDGQVSFGDYTSIQTAIDSLPIEGGTVLIFPGEYRETLRIYGRGGITLKGCGPSTILEPNEIASSLTGIVAISNSARITLRDLTIHAARNAVEVNSCTDIELSGVGLVAGSIDTGTFDVKVTSNNYCLVTASSVSHLEISNCSFIASTWQALRLYNVLEPRLVGLDNSGESELTTETPAGSYFEFASCTDLRFEDSSLTFDSRIGVRLTGSSNARLSGLSLEGRSSSNAQCARSVVVIESGCNAAELSESRFGLDSVTLSPDAVVVLAGTNGTLEDCTVEVTATKRAHVWGGVWVRSGAVSTTIRNNRIVGGYGHGITLGSVRWVESGTTTELILQPGPGIGDMTRGIDTTYPERNVTGEIGSHFLVVTPTGTTAYTPVYNELPLRGLIVSHNHIEGMGTNGISVLALKTYGYNTPLILEEILFENNTITQNLQQIGAGLLVDASTEMFSTSVLDKTTDLSLPTLPFGGIVLGIVRGSTVIRANGIFNNRSLATGTDARVGVPVNGVFLWIGDDVTICDNRIVENGSVLPSGVSPSTGVRAGIAVLMAGANGVDSLDDIRDLQNSSPDSKGLTAGNSALRVFGNTVRHPEGRAIQAASYGTTAVFGNFFSADGNRGSTATTETSQVGDVVFLENRATPWERRGKPKDEHTKPTDGTLNPRAVQLVANVTDTIVTNSPYRSNGRGGHLLFSSNQVTFDWEVVPATSVTPVSYYPVALYSIDHVGAHGNQLLFRTTSTAAAGNVAAPNNLAGSGDSASFTVETPLVAQLFAGAHTVNLSHNRFSEGLNSTVFSGVVYGQYLGLVAHNQGSHDFGCYGPALLNGGAPNYSTASVGLLRLSKFGNQVLYGKPTALPGGGGNVTHTGARVFFERQFRIMDTTSKPVYST